MKKKPLVTRFWTFWLEREINQKVGFGTAFRTYHPTRSCTGSCEVESKSCSKSALIPTFSNALSKFKAVNEVSLDGWRISTPTSLLGKSLSRTTALSFIGHPLLYKISAISSAKAHASLLLCGHVICTGSVSLLSDSAKDLIILSRCAAVMCRGSERCRGRDLSGSSPLCRLCTKSRVCTKSLMFVPKVL